MHYELNLHHQKSLKGKRVYKSLSVVRQVCAGHAAICLPPTPNLIC